MTGTGLYLWLKSLQVVAVIGWMAGLLSVQRLFADDFGAEMDSVGMEVFRDSHRLSVEVGPVVVLSAADAGRAPAGVCEGSEQALGALLRYSE